MTSGPSTYLGSYMKKRLYLSKIDTTELLYLPFAL